MLKGSITMARPRDKFCRLVFRVYCVGLESDDPCHGLCVNCAFFCDLGIECAQNGQLGKNTSCCRGQWCGFIQGANIIGWAAIASRTMALQACAEKRF